MPLSYILLLNTALRGLVLYNGTDNKAEDLNECLEHCAVEHCPGFMYKPRHEWCITFSEIQDKESDDSTIAYILQLITKSAELSRKCVKNNFSAYGLFKQVTKHSF